jgi:hypothetical protein
MEWGSLKYTESYWSLFRLLVLIIYFAITPIFITQFLICKNYTNCFSVIFSHYFHPIIISTAKWPALFYLFHIWKFQVQGFKFLLLYNWSWQHAMEKVNKWKCTFIQILVKTKLEVIQACASLFRLPLFTCKCTYTLTKSQVVHIYSHIAACQLTHLTHNFGFWE